MTTLKFEKKRAFLRSFNVAGFQYHEGPMVFDRLTLGTKVYMQPEFDNRHDHNAIAIFFLDPETFLVLITISFRKCNSSNSPIFQYNNAGRHFPNP